jgi:predicted MPP superfamily phosphohydrolase
LFHSLDALLVAVFILVQCRITMLLVRMSRQRFSGAARTLAQAGVFLMNAGLTIGYAFTFTAFLSYFHIPPETAMLLGATSLSYLLLATAIVLVHCILKGIERRWMAEVDVGRRRMLYSTGRVLMAAPVIALGYGSFIERHKFHVREVDIPLPSLPRDLDGLRLLQLTDIHLSAFLSEAEFARVIDSANELNPHIVLVTGDLISSHGDPVDACLRQLARLKSDAGIFGCMGNHERYAGVEDYTARAARRLSIEFLRSQARVFRFGESVLNVAGVDYQRIGQRKNYLRGAEDMLVSGALNVMLSHNPDVFPVAAQQGYNLLLAGHTHGGQISIEILDRTISPARFFTPFVYGVYHSQGATAYVSRGIGTIGIPARIGAPPEISLLRLRKA